MQILYTDLLLRNNEAAKNTNSKYLQYEIGWFCVNIIYNVINVLN